MTQEVIALLMPEREAGETVAGLRALIRQEDGKVVLQDVSDESTLAGDGVDRFQRAVPIRDPQTREVIGYEMQPVAELDARAAGDGNGN